MRDFQFKTKPFVHQLDVFLRSRDMESFALLMEQGTGKSKVIVDTAGWLWSRGKIDAVLIVAPNGVHRNWILNEFPAHSPDFVDYKGAWWGSTLKTGETKALLSATTHSGLKVVAINVEALQTEKGVKFIKDFLIAFDTLLVVDESSVIKNPTAVRTKNLLKLRVHAKYRRILTGTPVTQGPLDIFTQYAFLDPEILHTSSYYAFRNRYAILENRKFGAKSFVEITGYQRLDELQKLIESCSFRVTKDECLDLPDKLYQKRYVELSANQKRLYSTMKKDLLAEHNGKEMTAMFAMTKMLRLQQIVGGFFVPDPELVMNEDMELTGQVIEQKPQPIDKVNPRVESLIELLEETNGKVIIWARFRAEISAICEAITRTFGEQSAVEYHGGVDNASRADNIQRFQSDPACRFFIGHVQAGGKGLTLHAATTVVYFSNDFSLENRLQSEDRAHRIGQHCNVTYIDFIAEGTLDEKVVAALRSKKDLADLLTGDEPLESWI